MSNAETYMIKGHENIYMKAKNIACKDRKIRTEVSWPSGGTNEKTGMLMVIPGYGGSFESKIYKKIRTSFCDLYNMVVVQCDYFGFKYMGTTMPKEYEDIKRNTNFVEGKLLYKAVLDDGLEEFNDMGMMQALDTVSVTLDVINTLKKKGLSINTERIILFGTSHGAYIAYLANRLLPSVYSFLIDVSSYLVPWYLHNDRRVWNVCEKFACGVIYEEYLYMHPELGYADKLYDLRNLYHNFENQCRIISFHGTEDMMINYKEKESFINQIGKKAELMLITKDEVDGILCKSAGHGLDMNFLVLFQLLMPILDEECKGIGTEIEMPEKVDIMVEDAHIKIDYRSGRPELVEITF